MALSDASIQEILAEHKWKLVESIDNDGFGQDTLQRYIDKVRREDLDALVQWLEDKTSAENTTASSTVENPMAGTKWERSGIWTGGPVGLERDGETLRLTQFLFRGDLSIDFTVVDHNCQYKVEHKWFYAQDSIPTLNAPSGTTGVVESLGPLSVDPQTGKFTTYIIRRTRLYQVITEHTTRISSAATVKTTAHQGVKSGDKDDDGSSIGIQAMTSPVQGKILQVSRSLDADCTQVVDETEATVSNQDSTSTADSAAASSETTDNTENTAAVTGEATEGTVRRITNAPTEAGNFRTSDQVITPKNQDSTSTADSAAASSETTDNTENTAAVTGSATEGTVRRITNAPTEAGNFRTSDQVITPKNQDSTSTADSAAASSETLDNTENTEAVTGSAAEGTVRRITNAPTEAGNFRTSDQVITPKNQASTSTSDSAAASSETTDNTENTAAVTGSADAGTVRRITNAPTEAGKFRTSDQVITPKNQASTSTSDSAAVSSTTSDNTENPAAVTGSAAAGTVRRITNTPTDFGNFDTSDQVFTSKNQESTSTTDSAAVSSTTTDNTENSAPVTGSAAAGTVRRITNTPTDFGNFDTSDEVVTPKNQSSTSTTDSAAASSTTASNTENSAAVTGSAATGTTRTITNTPTPAGNFSTTDQVVAAKYQSASVSYSSAGGTRTHKTVENATADQLSAAAAALVGEKNNTMSASETDTGLYDYTITTAAQGFFINPSDWEGFGIYYLEMYTPREHKVFVQIKYTSAQSRAFDFCAGTLETGLHGMLPDGHVIIGGYGAYQTKPYYKGLGRWEAVRVEAREDDLPWVE